MQLPVFANALFWVSGHNLGLKRPANSCKQIAFAARAQGRPMHCRSMILVENLIFFKIFICNASSPQESSQQQQLWCHFVFKVSFEDGFLPAKIFRGLLTINGPIPDKVKKLSYL